MDYYTSYRLARFILAFAVWIASSALTYEYLLPLAEAILDEVRALPLSQLRFWTYAGRAVALVLVPPLATAFWALYELMQFLDAQHRRR